MKSSVTIAIPNKTNFKAKVITSVEAHYTLTECSIYQTGLTILNLYALNNIASKYLSKNVNNITRIE